MPVLLDVFDPITTEPTVAGAIGITLVASASLIGWVVRRSINSLTEASSQSTRANSNITQAFIDYLAKETRQMHSSNLARIRQAQKSTEQISKTMVEVSELMMALQKSQQLHELQTLERHQQLEKILESLVKRAVNE